MESSPLVIPPGTLIAAGLFLRHADDPRWLLLQSRKSREWGFPKGHQDPGETLLATARRETAEETGIGLFACDDTPHLLSYQVPSGRPKLVVYFPAVTRETEVVLSTEHMAFRWATQAEVLKLVKHPNLVDVFKAHVGC